MPFILTSIAGLSTLIGTIPIFLKNKNTDKIISFGCAFASGIMICVSIFDLIPESIRYLSNNYSMLFVIFYSFIAIIIGIFISTLMDNIIDRYNYNNLYKVGILTMISIIIHNIPEGIITYVVSERNIILGISICISIALHNIPEGISIAVPIYYSTGSRCKAIIYTFISSLSELFGAIITYLFLNKYINDTVLGVILSITAGIMISISFDKLLPTSKSYNGFNSIIFFMIGFLFMIISLLINNVVS